MMDHDQLELRCKATFAWWVHTYLYMLEFACWLMQCEPDYDKAAAIMMKGATLHFTRDEQ